MIQGVDSGLGVDHQARVANMREQVFGHRTPLLKERRKDLLVCSYYRVIGLEYIKANASIVCVNYCFDRVTEIVDCQITTLVCGRIGILFSVGKSVDYPVEFSISTDDNIR